MPRVWDDEWGVRLEGLKSHGDGRTEHYAVVCGKISAMRARLHSSSQFRWYLIRVPSSVPIEISRCVDGPLSTHPIPSLAVSISEFRMSGTDDQFSVHERARKILSDPPNHLRRCHPLHRKQLRTAQPSTLAPEGGEPGVQTNPVQYCTAQLPQPTSKNQ